MSKLIHTSEDPVESFKRASVATAKTLAGEADMDVVFSTDQSTSLSSHPSSTMAKGQKQRVRLPLPSRALSAHDRALVRGSVDAAGLRMRFHDPKAFRRHAPAGDNARLVYEALEQARCEAIGAKAMPGIGENLGAVLFDRAKRQGYDHATERAQIPIADVMRLLAREALYGAPIPQNAVQAVALWRPWVEQRIGNHLGELPKLLNDADAYAQEVRKLLVAMNMDFPGSPDEESEGDDRPHEADPQEDKTEQEQAEGGSESQDQLPKDAEQQAAKEARELGEGDEGEEKPTSGDDDAETESEEEEIREPPSAAQAQALTVYNAFTTQFDEVKSATDLCPSEELSRLRLQLDNQVRHYQGLVSKLANRLQRKLLAQQMRSWDFDREEGMLDVARLARVVASPGVPLSYKIEKDTQFRDTVVTLLIDNSGSMRGRPITIAAITADILARTLERCAVKVEVLGFTTSTWKGGKSREQWLKSGKPPHPGRLNDLRHIIYKSADAPLRRCRRNLGLMLREGLLKENIDGEALLWAHSRLLARREDRRILIVISDGAPVDDSTLSSNPSVYLEQHLREVITKIEATSPVQLLAIGIGHDVTRYYKRAVTITDVEQLGGTVMNELAELFDE